MTCKRETVLAALHTRLQTLAAPVLRGDVLPERIPAIGLIILRDGKPGEPEVMLSPLTYFLRASGRTGGGDPGRDRARHAVRCADRIHRLGAGG